MGRKRRGRHVAPDESDDNRYGPDLPYDDVFDGEGNLVAYSVPLEELEAEAPGPIQPILDEDGNAVIGPSIFDDRR